ncbi:sporulation integral membrane protein YlbJ [Anaerotaenia torta]|uniref:transporter n=1 Tax=Anaerotaenia torta TaxID=433293 RepID=UPI003D1F02A6
MLRFSEIQKNRLIKGFIPVSLLLMLAFPSATFQGASSGLLLWFHNVLPSLLPCIILSNLMVRLDITRQISRVFHPFLGRLFRVSPQGCYPIAIGFLSGLPMGAKATADLLREGKIRQPEAQFLLGMCNNASPMFIIGYISITQLKLPHIKYPLFAIIYGSAILGAVLMRWAAWMRSLPLISKKHFQPRRLPKDLHSMEYQAKASPQRFRFALLDESIMDGFETVTKVGGYIILFSILAQILNTLLTAYPGSNTGLLKAFLMGILEITTGISQICKSSLDRNLKIVLVTALTTFGGFSGMAQTKSIIGNQGLSMKSYLMVKLLSAGIALFLTYLYVTQLMP